MLLCAFSVKAQTLHAKFEGKTTAETKIIDSVSYKKDHANAKSIADEANLLTNTLQRLGYLESRELGNIKANDSLFIYNFSVGEKTKAIHIYTGTLAQKEKELLNITKDTITLGFTEVESFMNTNMALLEQQGYSISTLQLTNHTKANHNLIATLSIKIEKQRTLDDIVIEGYAKFPEGIRKNITKQYKGKTFNKNNLQRVYNDFNSLRFVTLPRYPEILFKQDTTKVYVYLQKANANTFDGFVGFGNDDTSNKVRFNGYVDLALNNIINGGEKFNLYWKSDGNQQTTFNLGTELPYLFKTPIGAKASLKIFKQDSTFQNTMTDLNLGYYFSYNSKLYLGYQRTQSVDIQNADTSSLTDYESTFFTSTYEYAAFSIDDFLFPQKTTLQLKGGLGSRDSNTGNQSQYFGQAFASHNLYLNKKNIINLKSHSYYLKSDTYIINELYRFGGINSIRGFNENSLQANLFTALMAEYRYVLSPGLYIHSITDYGYFQDKASNIENNLLSLGFGFGLLTKNGLFNIVYANGTTKDQSIKLSNSIVHISFKASF
ncbi:hypothetical protein AM493_10600 [Flavobacterium akiainvivens]|uniref:POTRA domain-containing protein n=1 Tax=Flavobacterium akiainvivens TaxID=1202724 RepID=A0A0M8MKX7_9FLAO|nr:hypothetical protein AM493_10600 [Flavobacterium akiainvivens]